VQKETPGHNCAGETPLAIAVNSHQN